MSSCCCAPDPAPSEESGACCGGQGSKKFDWLLWGSLVLVVLGYGGHLLFHGEMSAALGTYSHGVYELMNRMWWGLLLGILAVGLLSWVPREWVAAVLGKPGSVAGIFRAMVAGLILDLCNHGILLVAMKLYERGASYGQTLAFLIASPWNSLSLTLVLLALIGWQWTLVFILFSGLIALVTGLVVEGLVRAGKVPVNPNHVELPEGFVLRKEVVTRLRELRFNARAVVKLLLTAVAESRMILRWILFGTVLAAGIRALVPAEVFGEWFGPTWIGVLLTLAAATVIEVCSEGSSPIAADLVNRAAAPGNGFAFLMAGAATDYTEIMALRETTKSWKMTLLLPLLTLPQVVVIAVVINVLAAA